MVEDAFTLAPEILVPISNGASSEITWIGDTHLAYDGRDGGQSSVHVIDTDGNEVAGLASDVGFERSDAEGSFLVVVEQCCWQPDGAPTKTGETGEVVVLETSSFTEVARLPSPGYVVSTSLSNGWLAVVTADSTVVLINLETGAQTELGDGYLAVLFG